MTTTEATLKEVTTTDPHPERYLNCDCGAVLGYTAHIGKILYLFTYAYPPEGTRSNLAERRVNSRMLNGDVRCPYCGRWHPWTAAAEFHKIFRR